MTSPPPGVGRLTKARLLVGLRGELRRPAPVGRALADLRSHAAADSPWYRARLAGLAGAPLAELPVLTRDDLVDHFDELATDPALRREALQRHVDSSPPGTRLGRYWIGASSGSGGRPALLPFDRHEWAAKLANAARAQSIVGAGGAGGTGGESGRLRVARIASPSGWHLSAQVGATLSDPRRPTLRLPATTPFDELVDQLQRWRPTVLNGYASVLGRLADAQLAGDVDLAPRRVLSGAEPLTAGIRERIRSAWAVEPHDQYVATEAGFIAAECDAHDGMHVLADDVVLEVVEGAVLVTVLHSRTVPLIRYRIDDAVRLLDRPCRCGRRSPRLVVDGRARELLTFSHAGGAATVHPVVFTQVLDRQPVAAWQVVHRPDAVDVLVAGARDGFDEPAVVAALSAALADAGAHIPVTLHQVAEVPSAASGKAARFVER